MKLPHTVHGIVERGNGDGKTLGFPTANLRLDAPLNLEHGVYAARVLLHKEMLPSVLHFGPRLVFNETTPLFEVHILHPVPELYGVQLSVTLTHFIRKTMQFASLKDLVVQMEQDKRDAQALLKM